MAEDREAFRDLLDRIGQPYAPQRIVEGATRERARRPRPTRPSPTIGLPAIVRPAFTLGGTGGGIVETETGLPRADPGRPPGQPDRPGHGRALPRRLAGDRVRGDARRRRHVHRRLLDGERRPARRPHRRLDRRRAGPDPDRRGPPAAPQRRPRDHPGARRRGRLQRPVRALAGLDRVRGHRGQPARRRARRRWRRKATGYPIARVAAQIAVGRRLAEIPNVVTGTTVAAFEPALDYVVVKLPRFPFDKFPAADRTLGSQMKATGEVMAIDRTFGSALNKALRGLEQAGAGPLAEDPALDPDVRLPGGRLRRRPRAPTTPIRWVDESRRRPANRPATPSARPPRSSCAGSSRRPTRGCGGSSACCAGACPRRRSGEATGIAPWFLAEMGRNVALEARGPRGRARGWRRRRRTRRRPSCSRPPSGPGSATASSRRWPASTEAALRDGAAGARPRAGLRDGRHVRRGVRGRDAVLLLDVRRGRLGARGAAGRATGRARHRQRPGPDRAGDRVRLLRRPGRRHAPRARAGRR